MKGGLGGFTPGASSTFHYDALPEHLKKPYVAIRKAMIEDQDSIVIKKTLDIDTCLRLLESVLGDNPQIFWMQTGCSLSVGGNVSTIGFLRNRFAKDREKLKSIITGNAEEIYRKHVEGLRDAYSIELAVHDVLSTKVAYDGNEKESSHSLVGPLVSKKGVCDGISKAAAFLLNTYGVESSVVTGKDRKDGGNHAWNVVRIDRQWYNTDVTYDLQKGAGTPIRFYLNMDDAMTSKTHIQNIVGRCGSRKQNHYVRNGTYFRTADEAVRYIGSYRPQTGSKEDVYDLYVEENGCSGKIMAAISMKYIGKSAGTSMIMSNGRYLVTVRRRRWRDANFSRRCSARSAGRSWPGTSPGCAA